MVNLVSWGVVFLSSLTGVVTKPLKEVGILTGVNRGLPRPIVRASSYLFDRDLMVIVALEVSVDEESSRLAMLLSNKVLVTLVGGIGARTETVVVFVVYQSRRGERGR